MEINNELEKIGKKREMGNLKNVHVHNSFLKENTDKLKTNFPELEKD